MRFFFIVMRVFASVSSNNIGLNLVRSRFTIGKSIVNLICTAMNMVPVLNFIIYHFLQSRVQSVVIFNCWDLNTQFQYVRAASYNLLRTQIVDINMDFKFPGSHFTGIFNNLGVFLDLSCNQSVGILKKSSELQLFIGKYNWLIFDENYNDSELKRQFKDTVMAIDAQITYSAFDEKTSNDSKVSFATYDVYNNGKTLGGKLNITVDKQIACTKEKCVINFLSDLNLRSKYGNRCSLNDTTFRISTVVTEMPINSSADSIIDFLMSVDSAYLDVIARHGFHVVRVLQDIMNYNARYIFTNAWSYNETGGGSFGALATGDAELSSSGFLATLPRFKYASVILHIGDFRSIFMFRTPRNEGFYGGVLLRPFSTPVWLAFVLVLLFFAVMLWAAFAIEFRIAQYIKCIPSLLSTLLISFGLACFQSAALIPRTSGGRMIFLSLSVVTFIMYNYYTSAIVSSLIGSPIKSSIRTVGQLADSSLEIGLDPAPYTVAYLKFPPSPDVTLVRKKLYGRTDAQAPHWLNTEEGILKVRDGGFAYNGEASTAYRMIEKYYYQHELCDLNEVKLMAGSSLVTLIGKHSSYKEIIRLSLLRMLESGVISKHRHFWFKTKLDCYSKNILITIGLEYTGPLFVFLGIVNIFALIVLFLEIIFYKYSVR